MNRNNKNTYLCLFFGGVSTIGLLWILIFLGAVVKSLFFQQSILWGRNLVLLGLGIFFLVIGIKSIKKYEKKAEINGVRPRQAID